MQRWWTSLHRHDKDCIMWYFTWILGLGFAVAVAIISAIYLETNYAFGRRDETTTRRRFERFRDGPGDSSM